MKRVIIFCLFLSLTGCNYLRTFPLYSEVYVEHPEAVQIFDESIWADNQYYEGSENHIRVMQLKKSIEAYIKANPDTRPEIVDAMRELTIIKGMSKSEVMAVIGKPSKKVLKSGQEIWIYKECPAMFSWYYKWGKLKFSENVLIDIESQCIDIYK